MAFSLILPSSLFAAVPSLPEVRDQGFQVTMIDGERVPLAQLLPAARPVVVEFWATWCAPCRKSMPRLAAIAQDYQGDGLTVLALTIENPDTDMQKVRDFVSDEGIRYTIAFAPADAFQYMNQRDQLGVPKILVYDARGNVVQHLTKYSWVAMRRIEKAIRRVMNDAGR